MANLLGILGIVGFGKKYKVPRCGEIKTLIDVSPLLKIPPSMRIQHPNNFLISARSVIYLL
jgi:hypothetical protein